MIFFFQFNSSAIYEFGIASATFVTTILFANKDAGAVENLFTTR